MLLQHFSSQDHTWAVIGNDESVAVFSCKGEILKEYWYCIPNVLIWPEDNGKVFRSELIVYDGGDMTIIIHEDKKAEDLFLKDVTTPYPSSTDKFYFKIVQTIIKYQIEGGEMDKWKKVVNACVGVSEETFTRFHHL